ncbi:MAG: MFS transporter [Jatrophihabitans sp.]|uniref:MFS transporter n=1 Tax=Jatrophihabitans sp. TaxID=1932789 RepID=UPI003F7D17A5
MAKQRDPKPPGRFSKSGHTSHRRDPLPDATPGPPTRRMAPPPAYPPPEYAPPAAYPPPAYPPPYDQGHHGGYGHAGPPPSSGPRTARVPLDGVDEFGHPTYHGDDKPRSPAMAITVAAARGTNKVARTVTRKVITASKADGAHESGLTALIWNQVLSYGTDAMVTVALAGTVFFGASTHAQRGNVLLYLLITMAPFAVIAPVIGPLLDRLQHGRRWTMAGTAVVRGVLALIMAKYSSELLVLYPCALGSLVMSKAYGVVRAAAAPRLVPRTMTLTEANARLTIFGLGSTIVLGGLVGVLIKVTGSYSFGLFVTAIGFFACAVFAFKLPANVDSAVGAARHPQEPPRPRTQDRVPPLTRLQSWARRGFDDHLVIALQGESALRLLSGLLTIYLAFYVESTQHGLTGVLQLGGVVGAAGVGNFLGTAIGTRLAMHRPELIIVISVCTAAFACLLVALLFDILVAILGMLVAAITNALSKIALDALIQRDVVETLRSTAFGKSETFLQLAWVVGAAVGVVLPTSNGRWGYIVPTVVLGGVGAVVALRHRALTQASARREWPERPGTVAGDPYQS